ncbi:MAG TPA: hypothetical protein VK698_39705 [Kofleriaceae bacterium]|nr:hypothetical protein [Kofleriaceae bacterium]
MIALWRKQLGRPCGDGTAHTCSSLPDVARITGWTREQLRLLKKAANGPVA